MLRPLGTGEILDAGIKLYIRHWKVLMTCVVGIVLPVRIVSVLLVASANTKALDFNNGFQTNRTSETIDVTTGLVVAEAIVGVLVIVTSLLATAACFKAVADGWLGTPPAARRSLRYALGRLPALLVTFLAYALWFVLSFVVLLPGVGLGVAWFVVAGVALFVGWIWLVVAASLFVPAVMFERAIGFKALMRSIRLVRGRWWPTFATLLVGYLLAAVLGGIVETAVAVVPATLTDSDVALAVGNVVGSTLGAMITTPYTAAVVTLLYFDRRVRKEGFDLQLLAEGLGAERDPDAPLPAPLIEPAPTPEERAAAPYWPPPPGWKPPADGDSGSEWLPPKPAR